MLIDCQHSSIQCKKRVQGNAAMQQVQETVKPSFEDKAATTILRKGLKDPAFCYRHEHCRESTHQAKLPVQEEAVERWGWSLYAVPRLHSNQLWS